MPVLDLTQQVNKATHTHHAMPLRDLHRIRRLLAWGIIEQVPALPGTHGRVRYRTTGNPLPVRMSRPVR